MISVILPCRNEEKGIGICIEKINDVFRRNKIKGEIIVSDSSTDKSAQIAVRLGAGVVKHNKIGYGNALLEGVAASKGDIIVIGDADDSYDFSELPKLLNALDGYDMVIGSRRYVHKGAMPMLHRYFGNPMLSFVLRLFFNSNIKDVHSGFRAIRKEALEKLDLRTTGMEFASEMIIKAVKKGLQIKEVPIHYYRRKGRSKIKSFSDGWRHLRFMLLYSPMFLFFIPGLVLFLAGIILMFVLYFSSISIFGIRLYYHPMFFASLFILLGYQLMIFALFAKTYAIIHLGEYSLIISKIHKNLTIERAGTIGIMTCIIGGLFYLVLFVDWIKSGFGALEQTKNSIIAMTLIIFGIQTIFSSFMLSVLGIKEK